MPGFVKQCFEKSVIMFFGQNTFFCIIISLVKLLRLRYYWSTNPKVGHIMIKRTTAKKSFFQMLQYFHKSDKLEENNTFTRFQLS